MSSNQETNNKKKRDNPAKIIYKVVRSIVFSLILFVVGIYVLTYIMLSIPAFTNKIKDVAAKELSKQLGGKVEIESLEIFPFNEVRITGIEVYEPSGEKFAEIETVGGGISIWKLLSQQTIEITYGEIIGLNADIVQREEGGPFNFQFIIDAFAKKDDNKEKKPFELALRNVVLRKSSASFRRPWMGERKIGELDLSNLQVTDLAGDIAFPKISEKGLEVDLRRLSLNIENAITLRKLALKGEFGEEGIYAKSIVIDFPATHLYIPEIELDLKGGKNFSETLQNDIHSFEIRDSYIALTDFSFLNPILSQFPQPLALEVNAMGNLGSVSLEEFEFGNEEVLTLELQGAVDGLNEINNLEGDVTGLNLMVKAQTLEKLSGALDKVPSNIKEMISKAGDLKVTGDFSGAMANKSLSGSITLTSNVLDITVEGEIEEEKSQGFKGEGEININHIYLQELFPKVPIGNLAANIVAEGSLVGKEPEGVVSVVIENFEYKGKAYEGFSVNVSKNNEEITGDFLMDNKIGYLTANFKGEVPQNFISNLNKPSSIEDEEKTVRGDLEIGISDLNLSEITDLKSYNGYLISGQIKVEAEGAKPEEADGELLLTNFQFVSPESKRNLHLNKLQAVSTHEEGERSLNIKSDWFDLRAEGEYKIAELPSQLMALTSKVFPIITTRDFHDKNFTSDLDFDVVVKHNNALPEFFNLPVRLLVPVTISGTVAGTTQSANITFDVPYLQQGKDKLIYDTKVVAEIDGGAGTLDGFVTTTLPIKKGDLALNVDLYGHDNTLTTDLRWVNTENSEFHGHIGLETLFSKNDLTLQPEIKLSLLPSLLQMGNADWQLSPTIITYSDKNINIRDLRIWHGDQFVEVDGVASPSHNDVVKVRLADIDVDYVFDMLQINYVTFGGTATGEVIGHALLSGDPVAETEEFEIKDLTYNGCLIGDCQVTSKWNNDEKEIEIGADISYDGVRRVLGKGGIWLGRDSLSFELNADKVPVDFVQPFMAVFSSHVGGYATGDVRLFGTFHDIDMVGKIYADSVAVKLDYTNTIYHGSDSVYLYPGKIEIPHFELFDKNGNSAMLTGELTHRYFHDPSFNFRLSDAQNFLCYDTDVDINPDWYGVLYGSGSANLTGEPGLVNISADMTVAGNSAFTFVLNETQYARDYEFLTFSDKRKEEALKEQEKVLTTDDFKAMLKKRLTQDENSLSRFGIDIRATVTPQALFTLVMDPAAGDKITARGRGALQVKYESDDDEMMMYGKYEIDEGNYNFSLQDIILRDFKIKEGSYIAFNGNPLTADLDISAVYRVNTNLSDLDKSFSTDRDLNRTNVPVDAVLSVDGNMQSPDITFDIELPTLTQDVERKVKSIISTDDMMNRQIIYLLALNRFYTPEYMGSTGNGGELAAVASSTISSQLSNILGQLTDKFSVSPSFRSDKGDFSDIEVDVALSSRLLNNRLLINGNFGYRDRSNSSTTFVGDFDVEYLLSRNGNLRLKAYNHFNDQNYYLREALTTQGLGVVYRKDFDNWFTFLKKRKEEEKKKDGTEDTVSTGEDRDR